MIECLKHYRRTISASTNEPGAPLHDEYSHGSDAFRYMAVSIDDMKNESWQHETIQYNTLGIV